MKKESTTEKEFIRAVQWIRQDSRRLADMKRLAKNLREHYEALAESEDRTRALEAVDGVQQLIDSIPNH